MVTFAFSSLEGVGVLFGSMFLHYLLAMLTWRSEEGVGFPAQYGGYELNLGSLQGEQELSHPSRTLLSIRTCSSKFLERMHIL